MKLSGKACIVTGGASGIGRAAAIAFAREGARVTVADFNGPGGEETVETIRTSGGEAIFVKTDVAQEDDCRRVVEATVDAFGRLDVLFNNAGINPMEGSVVDMSVEDWRRVLAVNVDSIFFCSRFAIPQMRRNGGGRIINTASPASFKGWPGNAAYITSKGAVLSLTRAMAMDLAKDGIRVNALVPGLITTGIGRDFLAAQADPAAVAASNPMGRPGEPEEVAPLVVYLASDDCVFSTGSPFFVDGGELSGVA
ncbi:NAD(P)-dependent dehydrogenase (short-subunit alcohol dehydrogenase family) [Blastococcus colisei]|uniref:NAD(P)-dependent dehydrogenase (Short-subunit alcohol dehydrogenase family) n=1 Tax=Blastococcus colisei TaxID=1564162 RepID=A0A543PEC0_9ACTN|nr:glucose 1-dehydrogenase [Blastococcus colisei]TQN42379.1 NAD(P)-dependent dehydrogenase (short-subunit alcohol dehydrogenase family) [Blastococcus colisei]